MIHFALFVTHTRARAHTHTHIYIYIYILWSKWLEMLMLFVIITWTGQFIFPTYLSRLECRWRNSTSWGIFCYFNLSPIVNLGSQFCIILFVEVTFDLYFLFLDLFLGLFYEYVIPRGWKCMEWGIGQKLLNMLGRRAKNNALNIIQMHIWTPYTSISLCVN